MKLAKVLTIAGSDSGGGAGIQADLKTFQELNVFGMSAITAVTAQNTVGVHGVFPVSTEALEAQMDAIGTDLAPQAVKTGMLYDAERIQLTVAKIRQYRWNLVVVDPVMIAKGGQTLLELAAIRAVVEELLPISTLVTPNLPEAEFLTGMKIRNRKDWREAAIRLHEMGARYVLIKGGHADEDVEGTSATEAVKSTESTDAQEFVNKRFSADTEDDGERMYTNQVVDLLYDGVCFVEYSGPRIHTKHTHGTGCTLSAAITAELAKGAGVREAVGTAKAFIQAALEHAPQLGAGHGPTLHAAYRLHGPAPAAGAAR
ncbi:phosphomethylpyrimidine kinase [Paenibacillus swuensis]|uniref:Hydroxymethylpyrimidine/phosphomethylpyrimidine kinase n=1 Tax=Paenibacillus swuensis TaxID=1178515 RepID=A0A172TGZ4_9BACL|nr:bifunctional hydroxymethylpyrimidine kinase/phosphomethylpyrimidine kinase [Paenibacillus swuensis]ANE46328.1 phosphomethylpyrimidine kinase [Paenibacillus swuensis]